jgi:hypothetical protein
MALALDSKSALASSSASSYTVSFTNTGGNILFVGIQAVNGTVSAVSYAGVSMLQLAHVTFVRDMQVYALGGGWGTGSPATGANNVVVTALGGTTYFVNAISYSGASTSGQPDVTSVTTTGAIGGNTQVDNTIVTVTAADMLVLFEMTGDLDTMQVVAGGTAELTDANTIQIADKLTTTAGSYTISVTNTGSGPNRNYNGFLVAMKPPAGAPASTLEWQQPLSQPSNHFRADIVSV